MKSQPVKIICNNVATLNILSTL